MENIKLAEKLNLEFFNRGESKEVTCGYCGDLLSWVMGRAENGCIWMTVMNNNNVAAVAVLRDVSCIVLTEGVKPDNNLLERARLEGLTLCGTDKDSFTLSAEISCILKSEA